LRQEGDRSGQGKSGNRGGWENNRGGKRKGEERRGKEGSPHPAWFPCHKILDLSLDTAAHVAFSVTLCYCSGSAGQPGLPGEEGKKGKRGPKGDVGSPVTTT